MGIIRKHHKKINFVIIDKTALEDPKLSLKAKGLHSYLMCKPDDWHIYTTELVTHFKDGRDGIKAAIKELESAKYIFKTKIRSISGKFDGWNYIVYEKPQTGLTTPKQANPSSGNPTLLSNDNTNTDNKLSEQTEEKPTVKENNIKSDNPKLDYKTFENRYFELFKQKISHDPDYQYGRDRKTIKPLLEKYPMDILLQTLEAWFNDKWGENVGFTLTVYRQSFNSLLMKIGDKNINKDGEVDLGYANYK